MSSIKSEWPLVVFTTCAPLCAGAWIVAAFFAIFELSPQADMLTSGLYGAVLCALLVVSLVCSTLHLGKPLRALRAFMRLGNSTVSNEVFVAFLFALSAVLYLLLSQILFLAGDICKMLLMFVTVFAALFVLFQCLAYRMRTVPTWNSFSFSIEFAVIALLSGICIEGLFASLTLPLSFDVRIVLVAIEAACCAFMVLVVCLQGAVVAKSVARCRNANVGLGPLSSLSALRVLTIVVGSVVWSCGLLAHEPMVALMAMGAILILCGIVIGRYAFYRFYMNVGLPRV